MSKFHCLASTERTYSLRVCFEHAHLCALRHRSKEAGGTESALTIYLRSSLSNLLEEAVDCAAMFMHYVDIQLCLFTGCSEHS